MAPVLIGRFDPGSAEWHQARAAGIGGSEVAPILGLSPFESRFSLWHRKAGAVGPVEESPEMEWGKRLEPAILSKFAEQCSDLYDHPVVVRRTGTYHHPDRPWQIGNPDAEIIDAYERRIALVEIKAPVYGDGWGQPGTDEIPIYYRTQVIWYGDVMGLTTVWVPVLIGGHDYRLYKVDVDPGEAEELRTAAVEFLGTLARHERPDIDDHSATYQTIRDLHPDIDPTDHHLDGDLARGYIAAKAAAKAAEAQAQQATSLVADAMGTAARAVWDDTPICRRQAKHGGTPYVVAARGLDDLAATLTQDTAA